MSVASEVNNMMDGLVVDSHRWVFTRHDAPTLRAASGPNVCVTSIRMDFEYIGHMEEHPVAMVAEVCEDLEWLVEHGDRESNDLLARAFDGEAKRGQKVTVFKILDAALYRQYSFTKDTTEFTLFVRVCLEFDDEG